MKDKAAERWRMRKTVRKIVKEDEWRREESGGCGEKKDAEEEK